MTDYLHGFIEALKKCTKIIDSEDYSVWMSPRGDRYIEGADGKFHLVFVKATGFTAKWGETYSDDPPFNPYGAEIADIELTKKCSGIRNAEGVRSVCPFCYKQCVPSNSQYMSFEVFKHIFELWDKPKTLTQIAFGTDASLSEAANPDYWKIFQYCKDRGVTPNVTVADVDENTANKMASVFGACAVSYYPQIDKNRCYDTVRNLVTAAERQGSGMTVNIHALVAEETYGELFELLRDLRTDPRLAGVNAVVFLSLKQKGRGTSFNPVSSEQFKALVHSCLKHSIRFGMDSCSAPKFIDAVSDVPNADKLIQMVEPCESLLYSSYVDCTGMFYPCSFMEHEGEWEQGIDTAICTDFIRDIWYAPRSKIWRADALNRICKFGCNQCPYYNV